VVGCHEQKSHVTFAPDGNNKWKIGEEMLLFYMTVIARQN